MACRILHRNFEVHVFSRTVINRKHRLLLSSYTLRPGTDGNDGFPDGLSDCKLCTGEWCGSCISIEKRDAYDPSSTGYDVHDWRGGDYTRTHRDPLIINAMRGLMGLGKIVFSATLRHSRGLRRPSTPFKKKL